MEKKGKKERTGIIERKRRKDRHNPRREERTGIILVIESKKDKKERTGIILEWKKKERKKKERTGIILEWKKKERKKGQA